MLTFVSKDQMDAARVAMLSRVISRLTYKRWAALEYRDVNTCDADAAMRETVASMLDVCPDAMAVGLDALDAHPASEAMDAATQARFVILRCMRD